MEKQKVIYKRISEIKPYKNNVKIHSKEQVERIAKSIEELGFRGAILIDENNVVIAGHGRVLGAKKAGMKEVPCIVVSDLSEDKIKALRILDNKIAEDAETDLEALQKELDKISNEEIDLSEYGISIESNLESMNPEALEDLFEDAEEKPKEPKKIQCPHCGEWFEI